MSERLTFTIDRAKWLRGMGTMISALFNPLYGKYCCLGLIGKQVGYHDSELLRRLLPAGVDSVDRWPSGFVDVITSPDGNALVNAAWVADVAYINDSRQLSDAERERQLTERFAEHGIDLVFVGESQ